METPEQEKTTHLRNNYILFICGGLLLGAAVGQWASSQLVLAMVILCTLAVVLLMVKKFLR